MMECPSKEQVLAAANTSRDVRLALEKLFPEAFDQPLKAGQIYEWGTDADGWSGLVVEHNIDGAYQFVNYVNGKLWLSHLPAGSTKMDLQKRLDAIVGFKTRHNTPIVLTGPKYWKSWCLK